ncbi:conserved hypothetical protein [Paecilomyces variotii No. 5]|uniref:Class II aldolase/adducin N-terminal domain-containing protein n=1 Tax=Byssochlamys spectabilis (strain No. 5 / NBRC 109023) TaxID=1356009 RepID=V5I0Y4_BYSSN|nr:conserved hypothetical protein [Paecilomyces variotii No. 5]
MPPATVSSTLDIVEYYVQDASPVKSDSPNGYIERFIHSEIYKKYPDVKSVVHSHAHAVVPYSISGVPLRPCIHMAGFLGNPVPNFDILKFYEKDGIHDLLIRTQQLGQKLAEHFATETDNASQSVVLMRGHGFTAVGSSIPECVLRAIYTIENAKVQSSALSLRATSPAASGATHDIQYLDQTELKGAKEMTQWSYMRPWTLWTKEVETSRLYVNSA